MTARRLAWALVKAASVATTTSVVLSRAPPLVTRLERLRREVLRQAAAAEFAVDFERRRPEPWPAADQ